MAGRHLLDTNAVIALRNNDAGIAALRSLNDIIARVNVITTNSDTARAYGEVKDSLRRKGRPIPENDIWIAAIAIQHNLVLVTRDAHFDNIEGLACISC